MQLTRARRAGIRSDSKFVTATFTEADDVTATFTEADDAEACAISFVPRAWSRWRQITIGDVTRELVNESSCQVVSLARPDGDEEYDEE